MNLFISKVITPAKNTLESNKTHTPNDKNSMLHFSEISPNLGSFLFVFQKSEN